MVGIGPRVYGIASSIAAIALIGMLVAEPAPRGPARLPAWLALAPFPLTLLSVVCATVAWSTELTWGPGLAVLGVCAALGAAIPITVLVVRHASASRWWLVVPVTLVGLIACGFGVMSILVAIS